MSKNKKIQDLKDRVSILESMICPDNHHDLKKVGLGISRSGDIYYKYICNKCQKKLNFEKELTDSELEYIRIGDTMKDTNEETVYSVLVTETSSKEYLVIAKSSKDAVEKIKADYYTGKLDGMTPEDVILTTFS